ncbi:MAG: hypothetical protein MUF21_06495, partial [Gemmatimonadaceae bacterium]|nr:hypothetical protein [Gemmatimonadaceae bacterium]
MTQAGGVLPAVAPPPSRGGAVARTAAIARLELAIQRRDPLTALYPLVLGLLAFAYASGGPVELVPSRGAVARTSPWAIALACTGLVAFGQVITTMVAATVVLRDRAVRMDALLATGALRTREYLAGKLCAACVVLVIVYAAIPLGLWLGIAAGEGLASACTVRALDAVLRPFVALVLPVMVGVGALQFAAGVLAGRLWLIVGQGLVLIWLWSAALGAAGRGTRGAALLVDPFASAPLVASTLAWPDAMRRSTPLPLDAAWGTNRVAWFAIAGMALALAFARGRIAAVADSRGGRGLGAPRDAVRRDPRNGASRAPRDEGGARGTAHVARATASTIAADAWRRTAPAAPRVSTTIVVLARHTARWMLRDAGWRVLAALGA